MKIPIVSMDTDWCISFRRWIIPLREDGKWDKMNAIVVAKLYMSIDWLWMLTYCHGMNCLDLSRIGIEYGDV